MPFRQQRKQLLGWQTLPAPSQTPWQAVWMACTHWPLGLQQAPGGGQGFGVQVVPNTRMDPVMQLAVPPKLNGV